MPACDALVHGGPCPMKPEKMNARVSVIMPLYNAEAFVGEALESIRAQTLPVAEVIVVDDGSTDASAEVASRFPFVTLIRETHRGISPTLNRALDFATGDYLAFLDNDDRWLPEKTALQLAAFHRQPNLDLVFGHSRRFETAADPNRVEQVLDVVPGVSKTCLLIRRSAFEKVGRFTEADGAHDFLDWYGRAKEQRLSGVILPEIVAERRIHAGNYGRLQKGRQRESYLATLKAGLDRRRALAASPPARNLD